MSVGIQNATAIGKKNKNKKTPGLLTGNTGSQTGLRFTPKRV